MVTTDEVVSTKYFLLLETVKSLDTAINFGSTAVEVEAAVSGDLPT